MKIAPKFYRLSFALGGGVGGFIPPTKLRSGTTNDVSGRLTLLFDTLPYAGEDIMGLAGYRGFVATEYLKEVYELTHLTGLEFLKVKVSKGYNYKLFYQNAPEIPQLYYARVCFDLPDYDLFYYNRAIHASEAFLNAVQLLNFNGLSFEECSHGPDLRGGKQ